MSQTIFITGSSTGLGRAAARLFAERGWKVIATMRRPENATELTGVSGITVLPLDVTDRAQIETAARQAVELGGVDVLFNNAGYGLAGPLEGVSDEKLTRQMETNLLGVIRTTQAFLPHFRERQAGLIITTTSIGGLMTFPFNSVYHATKWALEGWSESMAFELAPHNIRIKTDFAGRSLDLVAHPAYAEQLQKVFAVFRDPARAARPPVPSRLRRLCMRPLLTTETSFGTWPARMPRRCMPSVRRLDPRRPGRRLGPRSLGSKSPASSAATAPGAPVASVA